MRALNSRIEELNEKIKGLEREKEKARIEEENQISQETKKRKADANDGASNISKKKRKTE